jgi:hypothetical protein
MQPKRLEKEKKNIPKNHTKVIDHTNPLVITQRAPRVITDTKAAYQALLLVATSVLKGLM